MSRWIKNDKYFATFGRYTLCCNDVNLYALYYDDTYLESGTKSDCVKAHKKHTKENK